MRVEVDTAGEATWLVLGQSHNRGWNAKVRGGDDLGAPILIDGYANGWRIDPTDQPVVVELEWTPQRRVRWALLLSGFSCVAGLAALAWWRMRRGPIARPAMTAVRGMGLVRGVAPRPIRASTVVAAGLGLASCLIVPLWAGALVGVAAFAALRGRRLPLALVAVALPGLVGAFVAVQQVRWAYPPIFEWPTLFPRARTFGWLAALLPAVVWCTDRLTRSPESDEATDE